MSVGYLVTTVVLALGTLFALAPPRAPRPLRTIGFYASLVFNEVPLYMLAVLLVTTAPAVADNGVAGVGWIPLAVAAATAAGLLVVFARGWRTRHLAAEAVAAELPEPEPGTRRRPLRWFGLLPIPWLIHKAGVRRTANLRYGDAGRRNLLDVYRGRSSGSPAPAFVYFHGGHFRSGNKNREGRPLLLELASRGWVCISANYRLQPEARFPDAHVDAKRVIAWTHERAEEYGIDRDRIVVGGSSAGAHLAALAALTPNDAAFQPGFEAEDTAVAAAVCLYGYYGALKGPAELPSRPAEHARGDAPPFLVVHGTADTNVPVEWAREFVEQLDARSTGPLAYAELPYAQHSFDLFRSPRYAGVVEAVESFASRAGIA